MLRDLIISDIDTIFNTEDFAEIHKVNGKDICCIIDSNAMNDSARVQTFAEFGVGSSQTMLFIKSNDFAEKLSVGNMLLLDKKSYLIEHFTENMGVYEITLSQNRNL